MKKFTGHERDFNEAGQGTADDLDYMHARYESSVTGRFLSVDSVLGKPEIPQSWNRYVYAQGNPLALLDSDGREPERFTGKMAQYVADPSSIRREGRAAGSAVLAAGSLSGGLALARVAGPALFSLAVRFQPVVEALRTIGAGLAGQPSPANPISGDFQQVLSTAKGNVTIAADAVTEGSTLILKNAGIYGDQKKAAIGVAGILGAVKELAGQLKDQGYTKLVITGLRYSGWKKGKDAVIVVDLTKLQQ